MKYIIKIEDKKEMSKRKIEEGKNYLSEIKLYDIENIEEKYNEQDKAYIFTNKQFAEGIANIVSGKAINIDTKEKKEKKVKNREWVNENKPSVEEVRAYCEKEDLNINVEEWLKYYNKVEWKTTKGDKIVNWKQKARVSSDFNNKKGIDCRTKASKEIKEKTNNNNIGIKEEKSEIKKKIEQAQNIINMIESEKKKDKNYNNDKIYQRAIETKKKYEEKLKEMA